MIDTFTLTISKITTVAEDVIAVDFRSECDHGLPPWTPGSHIDLHLPSGRVRKYSLCGSLDDSTIYTIAVLRNGDAGASAEIHDVLKIGDAVTVSGPTNNFPLVDAESYVFVAGGIGITPFLSMTQELDRVGRPWMLHYAGRTLDRMAFIDRLSYRGHDAVLYPSDAGVRIDFSEIVDGNDAHTAIYCCGPETMLSAALDVATQNGLKEQLRIERFGASGDILSTDAVDTAFDVELRASGITLHVPADRSLGDVLQDAFVPIAFSCSQGYCGSCRTRVLEGEPDHRDIFLSDEERSAGDEMMVCVGRACGDKLVLDL